MSRGPDSTTVGLNWPGDEQTQPGSFLVTAACLPVAIEYIGELIRGMPGPVSETVTPHFPPLLVRPIVRRRMAACIWMTPSGFLRSCDTTATQVGADADGALFAHDLPLKIDSTASRRKFSAAGMPQRTPAFVCAHLIKKRSARAETGLKARNLRDYRELIPLRPPIGTLQGSG
jgi:hypothetical protein